MPSANKFNSDVVSSFQSIIREYFFTVAESEDYCVRLKSQNVGIRISYDIIRGGEVGFGFCINPCDEEYDLREIYRELEVPNADFYSTCFSENYQEVISYIRGTADILQAYCRSVLMGDKKTFMAIELRSSREANIYTRQGQFRATLVRADKEWENKEYLEYINLLMNFKDLLSDSDCVKFEYAIKKVEENQ